MHIYHKTELDCGWYLVCALGDLTTQRILLQTISISSCCLPVRWAVLTDASLLLRTWSSVSCLPLARWWFSTGELICRGKNSEDIQTTSQHAYLVYRAFESENQRRVKGARWCLLIPAPSIKSNWSHVIHSPRLLSCGASQFLTHRLVSSTVFRKIQDVDVRPKGLKKLLADGNIRLSYGIRVKKYVRVHRRHLADFLS